MEASTSGLTTEQTRLWLALLKCPRFGWVSFQKLQQQVSDPTAVFNLSARDIDALPLFPKQKTYLKQPDWDYAERYANWLEQQQIQLIPYEHPLYPELLLPSARPPIALFVQGQLESLLQSQLAVVGTRSPTPYGQQVTESLIAELSGQSLTITSGMAIGIDGVAHKAALSAGLATVAVMATGFAHLYPKRHRALAEQICQQGALVTEFLPDVPPVQHNFPRRNRIIAGMAFGTLVVEAAVKSGSLITAQYALEEGRDVFAVPGNIFNPVSAGGHQLIQQGAKLVANAADIMEEQDLFKIPRLNIARNDLAENKLLASVDHDTTPVDVIVQRSNLPLDQVLMELLELEVQGNIVAVPGGYMRVT